MTDRTPAERKADALSREAEQLRAIPYPTCSQAARLRKVSADLVKAWRVVYQLREGKR